MSNDDVVDQAARILSTHETFTGKPHPRDHHRHQARSLDNAGLLARPLPDREQIAAAVHHVGWEVPEGYEDSLDPENCATCRDALNTADAVLALLEGRDG